eukprot:PhM_4_TR6506/c0_g1_i1/m.15672
MRKAFLIFSAVSVLVALFTFFDALVPASVETHPPLKYGVGVSGAGPSSSGELLSITSSPPPPIPSKNSPPPVGVQKGTYSPVKISVQSATTEAPRLGAGSGLTPEQICPAEAATFVVDYKAALKKLDFSRPPPLSMPWYYHSSAPLCGSPLLYYLTGGGVIYAIEKDSVAACSSGACTIRLRNCGTKETKCGDTLVMARARSKTAYYAAEVRHHHDDCSVTVGLDIDLPGKYEVEIKVTHVNGSSEDPRSMVPRSLGVIGIRVPIKGVRSYLRNEKCDAQRHVLGSPATVEIVSGGNVRTPAEEPLPYCTHGNYTDGRWVHKKTCGKSNPYCDGDMKSITDACGFNYEMVWAPRTCRYRIFTLPDGPPRQCGTRRGLIALVGDSVAREYAANCRMFSHHNSGLACHYENIVLHGAHYSDEYAAGVAKVMAQNAARVNPVMFATNLGMMHMIGYCTTAQWRYYVEQFAEEWVRNPPKGVERKVWLGPPTIQYANLGMGAQRAKKWDDVAWGVLEPLGFVRLNAFAITASRQESTWDGLHYAAEAGKKQTIVKHSNVPVRKWNGGVAMMLYMVLLNLICPV